MSDAWDEMRQANRAETKTSVQQTAVPIVSISDMRVSLLVSSDGTGTVYLGFGPSVAVGQGVCLTPTNPVVSLDLIHHGRMVRGPVWAVATAGTVVVTVWEALHPCACLL